MSSMMGVVALTVFLLVILALEGNPAALWSGHAFVMVIGGSLVATLMSFPAGYLFKIPRLCWEAIRPPKLELPLIVATLVKLADKLRMAGIQGIQKDISNLDDPFLRRGMQYIAEGFDSQEIQDLLEAEMLAIRQRHRTNIGVFESLGGFCPTMGILGTVVSMVAVLANLERPETLGPQIATAMVATLYGVGAANLVFLPMATKLRKASEEELRIRWVMVEIVLALQAGAHPRLIRERLKVSLPPSTRKLIQDLKGRRRQAAQSQPMEPEMAIPQYEEG
ncbi:MAG: MotA/TolQ/ExbB proton channel family protein [Candidatus Sericytochromatia bacterium]|nr:MotA/TolQ/ExbB proton channel family protein [Candidatus Tanganyikabacteria bacterium]